MKKTIKKMLLCGFVTAMTISSSLTVFAGQWKLGAGINNTKWWYDNNDGTYAANGWYWLDGNSDGIAECYYFDSIGWLLTNTTTPDGYQVNADGAWTENGVVQIKIVNNTSGNNDSSNSNTTNTQQTFPLSEQNGFKVGDTTTMGNGQIATYQGNDEWFVASTNTKYIVREVSNDGRMWLDKVIPESEWTHYAEDYGYSIGDTMSTVYRGEHLTLEYHGNDKWEDQNGTVWTSYMHKDGTLHWSTFG